MGGLATPGPGAIGGHGLLTTDEPDPVQVINPGGASPFLLLADHAGRRIPRRLGTLGLSDADLHRHIAWDIGMAGVARLMAGALDAIAICQAYSRLVVDCNRRPGHPGAMPTVSEATEIPGNRDLSDAARAARMAEVFQPYHDRIAAELDRRAGTGTHTLVVALHSFTPVYAAVARPWHAGVLHDGNSALSHRVLALLRAEPGLVVGDNEPYRLDLGGGDHTVPTHALGRGLDYLELEIRQDLIATVAGEQDWADRMARLLRAALEQAGTNGKDGA